MNRKEAVIGVIRACRDVQGHHAADVALDVLREFERSVLLNAALRLEHAGASPLDLMLLRKMASEL